LTKKLIETKTEMNFKTETSLHVRAVNLCKMKDAHSPL